MLGQTEFKELTSCCNLATSIAGVYATWFHRLMIFRYQLGIKYGNLSAIKLLILYPGAKRKLRSNTYL